MDTKGTQQPEVCAVSEAALMVLDTYTDILADIFGNPEERPVVLTPEHRVQFCDAVMVFHATIDAHGMPYAHEDLRPYGGTAARGAVHALSKKLVMVNWFLRRPTSDNPDDLTRLMNGEVVIAWWQEIVRDQARTARTTSSSDAGSADPPVEEQVIGWARITAMVGFSPKDRRGKELVERLNRETHGPIKQMSKRTVVVGRNSLIAWWNSHRDAGQEIEAKVRLSDRDSAVRDKAMSNGGVRKDEGFHLKESRGR